MSYNLERTLNCVLISRDIENEKQICINFTNKFHANIWKQDEPLLHETDCLHSRGELLNLDKQSRTLFLFLAHSGPIIHLWQKER